MGAQGASFRSRAANSSTSGPVRFKKLMGRSFQPNRPSCPIKKSFSPRVPQNAAMVRRGLRSTKANCSPPFTVLPPWRSMMG